MKKRLRRILSSWIFWGVGVFLFVIVTLGIAALSTPFSEDALKIVLKQETFKDIELSELRLKKKHFDLLKLKWTFELSAHVEKIWGIPVKIKNLTLEGTKGLWSKGEVERGVLRFSEEEKIFKGGLAFSRGSKAKLTWDLSNLEFALGSIEKKIGVPAYLKIEKKTEEKVLAELLFDGLKIPLELSFLENSFVVQIPKTTIQTHKQKLPLVALSEVPTTGEWTFASRLQFAGDLLSEATFLEVSDALINVADVSSDILRNGRGVGVLNLKLSSSEGLLNGTLNLNLDKATFELNEGRYFKVESAPFELSAKLDQNAGDFKITSDQSSFVANLKRNGDISGTLKDFDLSLIPNAQKIFGVTHNGAVSGAVSGEMHAKLISGLLGSKSIELESIRAEKASLALENYKFPLLVISGKSTFEGSFDFSNKKKSLKGDFDFTKSRLSMGSLYEKKSGDELYVRTTAEYVNNSWKTFQMESVVDGQRVHLKKDSSSVVIQFPNTIKGPGESILSGSVTYALCEDKLCEDFEPTAYNLRVSDYSSHLAFLNELKISGNVSKKGEKIEAKDLTLRWPSGDSLVVDGKLDKFKTLDLKIKGDFDFKNIAFSNPFLFFKEMPVQKGNLELAMNLKRDNTLWNFIASADIEDKALHFDRLSIKQSSQDKENNSSYEGRAQIDLEPYLLRNEAITLTSTLKNSGDLAAFQGLLMRGRFDAELVLATSGLNPEELLKRFKLRASGDAELEQLPITLLISQGLKSYAKERQKASARSLAKCYPQKLRGKFDFDYSEGKWNLAPSAFQGVDRDSIVKIQGVLGDLSSVNLISHYLPGPKCDAELAACLGDAFPKGGMSFEITGAFKDPETDLDFAFIDQSLERCREIEARREVASDTAVDKRDQRARIQELKDFYNSRNLSR
ncbi:MAG: hypothetical protein R3A80_00920 [Bdellovibrionota bacterium]